MHTIVSLAEQHKIVIINVLTYSHNFHFMFYNFMRTVKEKGDEEQAKRKRKKEKKKKKKKRRKKNAGTHPTRNYLTLKANVVLWLVKLV